MNLGISEFLAAIQVELTVTLLVGIMSYAFGRTLEALIQKYRAKQGDLAGEWIQESWQSEGQESLRRDRVTCRHIGETVTADIQRVEPENQRGRIWSFHGVYRGNELFGHFSTKDSEDPSYGTIVMIHQGRGLFKGSYSKSKRHSQDWRTEIVRIETIPLIWRRSYINDLPNELGYPSGITQENTPVTNANESLK